MKFTPIFALLAVSTPILAQAQTPATADVPAVAAIPMAPKTAETADAWVWRFAPPVGSKWTMRSFSRATSNTQVPAMNGEKAQPVNFKVIQKMTADYDVLSRDALGATTVRMTLREMTQDMTFVADGKTVSSPQGKTNPKAVDGATLTIKQSSDGKIWGVVGMRAYQRRILEANGALTAQQIDEALDLNPLGSNNKTVNSLSMAAGTLPISPVRLGESWTYNVSLPAPLSFEIEGKRTIKSLDSAIAVVADSAVYEGGKSQTKMPKMAGMPGYDIDFSQLNGLVRGTSRVQRSSGLPLESTADISMSGSITSQIPAMDGVPAQKITLPMNVTSSARVVMEPR